ncbi:hypothetical protein K3495_g15809 [Podosphaera aphanis]|nr:hypothetical protein K3495_g15809 [Podosphaera aphanis]
MTQQFPTLSRPNFFTLQEKAITKLRSRNLNNLWKPHRTGTAAAVTSETSTSPGSSSAPTLSTEASSVPSQRTPSGSQNRFSPLSSALDGSIQVDLDQQVSNDTSKITSHKQ